MFGLLFQESRFRFAMSLSALMIIGPVHVSAQPTSVTPQSRLFIDGGVLADRDTTVDSGDHEDAWGTTGISIGVGAFVLPRVSLRAEVEVPARHRFDDGGDIYTFYDPAVGRTVTGPSDRKSSNRKTTYAALVAYHQPLFGRLRVALLGGFGISDEANEYMNYKSGTDQLITEYSGAYGERVPIVTFGIDAEISVGRHLSVMPRLRTHGRQGFYRGRGTIIRPGVAVRWRF